MKEFNSPEELRQFLLSGPGEFDDVLGSSPGKCYSLSWKKDHWIIRANNKKVGVITKDNIPVSMDIKDNDLLFEMLRVLREASKLQSIDAEVNPLEELNKYLAGLNENIE